MQPSTFPQTSGATADADPGRLIRLPATLALVGLGRSAWLDLVQRGLAPQRVKIGKATLWVEAEVLAFIAERIRQSRGGK